MEIISIKKKTTRVLKTLSLPFLPPIYINYYRHHTPPQATAKDVWTLLVTMTREAEGIDRGAEGGALFRAALLRGGRCVKFFYFFLFLF